MLECIFHYVSINIQSVIVFFVVLLPLYSYYQKQSWRGLPPGPPCLPVVGSLPFLGMDIRKPLLRMRQKYGDIFTVHLGTMRAIVLNGNSVIREALVKSKISSALSGRPSVFFIEHLTQGYGIVSSDGDYWRSQRRFTHSVLRDFGVGRSVLEERVHAEIHALQAAWDSQCSREGGAAISPMMTLMMAAANIISNVTYGVRKDYDDPLYKEYMRIMIDISKVSSSSGLLTIFPFLVHLPGDFFNFKKVKKDTDFMDKQYNSHICKVRKDWEAHPEHVNNIPSNVVEAYLQKMITESATETYFTDISLIRIIGDLIDAGTDTTSTTLNWAIIYMVHYPDVQSRVVQEITEANINMVSMADRLRLPFVEATLLEVQRLADIVPFSVPHRVTKDVWLRGYILPAGTTIIPNLNSVHRDPQTWTEPEKFDPERFLDKEGRVCNRDLIMPFGVGKRQCLGEALARMELFLFFTSIMQRYKLSMSPYHPPPALNGYLSLFNNALPYHINIQIRGRDIVCE